VDSWSIWNRVLGESLNSLWEGAFLGVKVGHGRFSQCRIDMASGCQFSVAISGHCYFTVNRENNNI